MVARFTDFRKKEIINIRNGVKIGYVDDMILNTETAAVDTVVVHGRLRLFGLFGRDEDMLIRWESIEMIGEDTILVRDEGLPPPPSRQAHQSFFTKLFG